MIHPPRTPEADMRLSKPIYSFTKAREKRRNKIRLALFAVAAIASFVIGAML